MANLPRLSLRVSLAGALIGAVLLTSCLLGIVTFTIWKQSLRDDLTKRMADMVGAVALLIDPKVHHVLTKPEDMQTPEYQNLREKLMTVRKQSPDIRFLYTFRWKATDQKPHFVLDTGIPGQDFSPLGEEYENMTPTLKASFSPPYQIRVEKDFYTDEYGTFLSAFVPILLPDGTLEGVLGLDMDAKHIAQLDFQLLALVAGLTLAITILMGALSWWFARRISRPLLLLSQDMGRIQEFKIEGEVEVHSRISEVVTMKTSLENMKRGLRSFKKYVPSDLVAELIGLQKEAVLGTEKCDLTIFFCDLENFTTASEKLASDDLNRLLTEYFDTVTRILQKHGATVDKFIGDAVMAFWNAPRPIKDHAFAGSLASLEVHGAMNILSAKWKSMGLPPLATRIGLNTGTVLVGNVGQENRLSYTALGDAVNLASRLESLSKYYGTQILAAEETLRLVEGRVAFRPVDRVAVKGKTKGTLIAELADAPLPWWEEYLVGWGAYLQSHWKDAAEVFEKLHVKYGDGPSKVLSERCKKFLEKGVPNEWSGVWVMNDK